MTTDTVLIIVLDDIHVILNAKTRYWGSPPTTKQKRMALNQWSSVHRLHTFCTLNAKVYRQFRIESA